MLSIGIRCGQGFDRESLKKLIEIGTRPYEYDVLVLGANPGGMVCAREVSRRGKKTALVHWRIPTPGEEEGYDENEGQMFEALQLTEEIVRSRTFAILEEENKTEVAEAVMSSRIASKGVTQAELPRDTKYPKWSRKVRKSRQDLKNAITNMVAEALSYMHEMAMINDLSSEDKRASMSWENMMEQILDHLIRKNWSNLTDFVKDKINIFKGYPVVMDDHSVKVLQSDGRERIISAETMISAVEVHNSFPKDVAGAKEFGVNFDDFFRLSSSPRKTLVVGAGRRGMECAGILAAFRFPVSVVYRSEILKDGDDEIVEMIVKDLMHKGVKFLENKSLVSIQRNQGGDALLAEFISVPPALSSKKKYFAEFDTILFTTKEKPPSKNVGKSALQIEIERLTGKTYSAAEKLMFQNVLVVPDRPSNMAATKLSGKRIGQQLSGVEESQKEMELIPNIILTPLEYAYVGTSEAVARNRLGEECVDLFSGYFQTEDVIADKSLLKDDTCFAKVVAVMEKDLVVGLHLLGKDAVQIMSAILDSAQGKMRLSNIHPVIRDLIQFLELGGEADEKFVRDLTF